MASLSESAAKHLRSNVWLIAERLLNFLYAFLIGLLIIRSLGPEKFGELSYVVAFSAFFTAVIKFGLDMIVVKMLVEPMAERATITISAWFIRAMAAISILAVVLFYLLSLNHTTLTDWYLLVIAVGGLFQTIWILEPDMQAREDFKSIALCKIVHLACASMLRVALIAVNADVTYFVVAIVLDYIALSIAYIVANRQALGKISYRIKIRLSLVKAMIIDALPILLSSISIILYTKMDQWMIAHMVGVRELGVYSASVKVIEATYFVPMVLASVCLTVLLRAKKSGPKLFKNRVSDIFSLLIYSGLLVTCLLYYFSVPIVSLLYGLEYLEAASSLRILSLATVFVYIGAMTTPVLVVDNLQRYMFIRTMSAALVNLVLNISLIPIYGINGAAYATVISAILAGFLFDGLIVKTRYLVTLKLRAIIPRKKAIAELIR